MTAGREQFTTDQLTTELDALHELTNAMLRRFLGAIADFDERQAWREDGASSMRDWLTYRYGCSVQTGRLYVGVAAALEERPAIAEAFEKGALSQDKVVDLCSFVPPEEDAAFAKSATEHNAAQVKEWARHARRIRREEAQRASQQRSLRLYWDRDRHMLRLSGLLPGADGATVKEAIERVAHRFGPNDDGTWNPLDMRQADALVELAGHALTLDADNDRATIVVHVDAGELNHVHGMAKVEDGPMIASEVVRRLLLRDHSGRLRLVRPDGRPVMNRPKGLRPEVRDRMLGPGRQGPHRRPILALRN